MSSTPSTNELVILGAPVALRDGTHVRVRQWHRSDKELLRRGFQRLGPESRYKRFLAPMPRLSEAMVRDLTEVDHHEHEAIVALEEETGEGIGVVRYFRSTERHDAAEFAVTVIDDWQRRGVGTLLLEVTSARAREDGITTFTAVMLASNHEMMEVLRSLGPVRIVDWDAGAVEIEMPIPAVGLSPALSKLLRIAARNDVVALLTRPRPDRRSTPRARGRESTRWLLRASSRPCELGEQGAALHPAGRGGGVRAFGEPSKIPSSSGIRHEPAGRDGRFASNAVASLRLGETHRVRRAATSAQTPPDPASQPSRARRCRLRWPAHAPPAPPAGGALDARADCFVPIGAAGVSRWIVLRDWLRLVDVAPATCVRVVLSRGYDPGVPLDDDVHRDAAWGTSSVGTHDRGRRLARYEELAAVKLSSNGATFVFEPELHELAALIILNGVLEQVGGGGAGGAALRTRVEVASKGRGVRTTRARIAADARPRPDA